MTGNWNNGEGLELWIDDKFFRSDGWAEGTTCSDGKEATIEFELEHSANSIKIYFIAGFKNGGWTMVQTYQVVTSVMPGIPYKVTLRVKKMTIGVIGIRILVQTVYM